MRALLLSMPFASHFTPMLPLAWALQAGGHEVIVGAQPDVTDAANAAGLCTAVLGDRYEGLDVLRAMTQSGKRMLEIFGRPPANSSPSSFWGVHARYLLPRYLEFARTWRPDVVISEQLEFAGTIVAETLGVPSVQHRWGIDPLSGPAREHCRIALHGACTRLGLTGLPDPTVLLDPCPAELQVPGATAGKPIRYVPYNGTGQMPDWSQRGTTKRRVCVSLGRQTVSLNGVPLMRSIVNAFDGLAGVEAIVTVDAEFFDDLGPVPGNVRLVEPTPLNLFLDTCDAIVHHGGANTAMTATSFGLPQLILPQIQDQFGVADRLVDLGIAAIVDEAANQDDPAMVRAGIDTVLSDERYAKAAAEMRDSMAKLPSPAEVVRDLEELV